MLILVLKQKKCATKDEKITAFIAILVAQLQQILHVGMDLQEIMHQHLNHLSYLMVMHM